MSLRAAYATDSNREEVGIEVESDLAPGVFFTLRRQGGANKEWSKQIERLTKPYRRQMELGTMREEIAAPLFREAFVKACVVSWRGVTLFDVTGDPKDKDVAFSFSYANCIALFDALPAVYEEQQAKARDIANFRDAALEEEAKN